MKNEADVLINVEDLTPDRERMLLPLCIVGASCFIPFFFYDLARENYWLSLGLLFVSLVFVVNGYAIYHHRKSPIPFVFLLVPAVVSIVLSIIYQGVFGTYWCYPALIFFYFVLSRRTANICAILLLVAVTYILTKTAESPLTIRFAISLTLVIVMANIIVGAINDLHRRLLDQTIKDPLTGAYNRRHMKSYLTDAVSQWKRHKKPASILLMDIDYFKRINDELGHGMGDKVLVDVVSLVIQRIRHTDKLFRFGGEEFLVFLPETVEKDAATVAAHLCEMIGEANLLEDRKVTISIGVSQIEADDTLDDWIKYADEVLYQAKQNGRNRFICRSAAVSRADSDIVKPESGESGSSGMMPIHQTN